MPKTISQQLDEVFHQATMSYVRGMLKTEQDRAEFERIDHVADETRDDLTRLYREEYASRVDAVRRRLYDEAAEAHLDHPLPPGGGSDGAGAIDREANRQVQLAHEADLVRLRDEAQRGFEALLERAHRRNEAEGQAVEAFGRAGDRRSGRDRRNVNHSQD